MPQTLGLLEDLTIGENVMLPARLNEIDSADDHGDALMRRFGLDHLIDRHPGEISLGEQQRTAVARALLLRPALVLADEPTAHQDHGASPTSCSPRCASTPPAARRSSWSATTRRPGAADRLLTMADGRLA